MTVEIIFQKQPHWLLSHLTNCKAFINVDRGTVCCSKNEHKKLVIGWCTIPLQWSLNNCSAGSQKLLWRWCGDGEEQLCWFLANPKILVARSGILRSDLLRKHFCFTPHELFVLFMSYMLDRRVAISFILLWFNISGLYVPGWAATDPLNRNACRAVDVRVMSQAVKGESHSFVAEGSPSLHGMAPSSSGQRGAYGRVLAATVPLSKNPSPVWSSQTICCMSWSRRFMAHWVLPLLTPLGNGHASAKEYVGKCWDLHGSCMGVMVK